MPSSVVVPAAPLLQRETSTAPFMMAPSVMANVPVVCPPTVLPPAQAAAPAPSASCVVVKGIDAMMEVAPPKPPKRARSAKGTTAGKADPEGPPAVNGVEPAEEMKTPESGSWLIVAKAVRMHLKSHETAMHCGSDALPALNAKLADMIKDAIVRAQSNGRKTLKACDF